MAYLKRYYPAYIQDLSQDDECSSAVLLEYCHKMLGNNTNIELVKTAIPAAKRRVRQRTAWRIEGTLREFPKFPPINLWFNYPVHYVDDIGSLKDIEPDGQGPAWQRNFKKKKSPDDLKKERIVALQKAFEAESFGGTPTVKSLASYLDVTEKTVKNHIRESGMFAISNNGEVVRKTEKVE